MSAIDLPDKSRSTTPKDERPHCPECGSIRIHRVGDKRASQGPVRWHCETCKTDVDEPHTGPLEGLE